MPPIKKLKTAHEQNDDDETGHEIRQLLVLSKTPSINIDLSNITKLDLFQAGLNSLPTTLPKHLPNLSILFCMKNQFVEVPAVVGECKKLQMVGFKSNQITHIHPEALQPQMRWLILTDNKITSLPSTIGRCKKLQKFMLSGNLIEELPGEISLCHNLELIRLASNRLKSAPLELLGLPNLSWVALSDNPFLSSACETNRNNEEEEEHHHLKLFKDDNLDDASLGTELGRGASGVTRKFVTRLSLSEETETSTSTGTETESTEAVAVKEYSSAITSDGNPQEERKVSMIASSLGCSSLVKVLGRTNKGNLIMELLKDYKVFANSPSLESCSRDVYDDQDVRSSFTEKRAVAMVGQLLFALLKLHERGICHGDFYGHNILISNKDEERVWLTDFGAAFFYDGSTSYGKAIQKIERRAFGHLVKEIAELLKESSSPSLSDGDSDPGTDHQGLKWKLMQFASTCHELTFEELHKQWIDLDIK